MFRKKEEIPIDYCCLALRALLSSTWYWDTDTEQTENFVDAFSDHWFRLPPARLSTVSAGVFIELGNLVTGAKGFLAPDDADMVSRIWCGLIDAQLDPDGGGVDPPACLDLDMAVLLFEAIKARLPLSPVPFEVMHAMFVTLDLDVD
jgi:hypothetical protein